MYRMLVVDDEPLIVNSLCSSIEQNFDVELYRANSAFNAMTLLQKMRFDVVITDISMPVMNGLELLKWIRGVWPQCYVLLLTAYDKFDYAYESMKYDRVQYILKVESYAVIHQSIQNILIIFELNFSTVKSIQNILDKLDAEKKQEQAFIQLGSYMEQMKPLMKADMASRLLRFGVPLPGQDLLDSVGFDIRREEETCIVVGMPGDNSPLYVSTAFSEVAALSMNRLSRRDLRAECVPVGSCIVWFLQRCSAEAGDEATWTAILCDAFEELPDVLEEKNDMRLMLATDACMHPADDLKNIFTRLTTVLEQERNESGMRILPPGEDPPAAVAPGLDMDQVMLLWEALKTGEQEDFRRMLSEGIRHLAVVTDITQTLPSATISAVTFLYMSAAGLYGLSDKNVSPEIRGLGHLSGQQWITGILNAFDRIFEEKQQLRQSGDAGIAEAVRVYVAEHFTEDIHLTTLAEHFHYSPSYLSRLYKKMTGDNLTGAINNQRIVHARSLLEHTALPVGEVARQSGFYSTKYFLQLFKKKTGMTPSQYRKNTD